MKLVFFGDAIVEHLRRWTTFFARQGHEVHVITWNLKVLDGYGAVHVHPMPKALSSSNALARAVNLVSLTRRVRRLLRQIQPDLIHAHSAGPYAWMGMVTRFRPFLITPWGSDVLIHVHDSLINHYFTVRALRHADCVQAEGEDTREALLQLGVDNRNIIVLPIGVDTARYRPGKPSADFLAAHGLAGSPVVVSTRTPTPVHDVDSTIHAAAIVLQKAPAVKFLIVGGGSELPRLKDL
ncbi:MAG: glycosyltransferase, partial [Phycisphaerales bacterium]